MQALTVRPGIPGSMELREVAEPEPGPSELLVDGIAVGLCGTDDDIADGTHGAAPPGRDHLVIGHESLGKVSRAPANSGFAEGDLVAGVVRRPDPVPCGACAAGEFDMCRNGRFTERGIKQQDGYASRRWAVDPQYAVAVDPGLAEAGVLVEPTSIVTKAWEQIDQVGGRSWFRPECVLVTGAGPIGLLAALIGVQRGLDVHVLDQVTEGPKPDLVSDLGATYHHEDISDLSARIEPDVVIEATGAGKVVLESLTVTGPYGVVCLTGMSTPGRHLDTDPGELNRDIVLENDVVLGTVSSHTRHFAHASDVLAAADPAWLRGLITRRVPLDGFGDAFHRDPASDVKVVVDLTR